MHFTNTPRLNWENTPLILGIHHGFIGKMGDKSLGDNTILPLETIEIVEGGCLSSRLSTPSVL